MKTLQVRKTALSHMMRLAGIMLAVFLAGLHQSLVKPALGADTVNLENRSPASIDDSFKATVNDSVTRLIVQHDDKILMCGSFTQVNGASRQGAARLHPDGSLDPSFNPPAISRLCIQQADGRILAITPSQTLVRLRPDGALDTEFTVVNGYWCAVSI